MKTGGEECAGQRRNRRSAIPALLSGARWVDGNAWRRRAGGDPQLVPSSKRGCGSRLHPATIFEGKRASGILFPHLGWRFLLPGGFGAPKAAEMYLV